MLTKITRRIMLTMNYNERETKECAATGDPDLG